MPTLSPSRRERLIAGSAAIGVALAIEVGVHTGSGTTGAPMWVGDAAALAFALAGSALLADAVGSSRGQWVASLASALILLAIALWVVLGPGNRACTFSFAPITGAVGSTICRGVFGAGSLILVLFILLVLRRRPPAERD